MACAAACAHAATFRVDDTATLPSEASTTMQWRSPAPGRGASDEVGGSAVGTVRGNTPPGM
jgi:hypothetical protein